MRRLLLLAAIFAVAMLVAAPAYAGCGSSDYSYAGFETHDAARGVSASITALAVPEVKQGHVAGWVGVNGTNAWIQIGLNAFPEDSTNHVYVEFADHDRTSARVVGWDVFDDVGLLKVDPSEHAVAPTDSAASRATNASPCGRIREGRARRIT